MDFVLRTGDLAIFDPVFGAALVVAPPGVITGSSRARVQGATVCVQGDEATVIVLATYTTGALTIPGTCLMTIEGLGFDQTAIRVGSLRRRVLLRGSRFRARLQVTSPATNPPDGDTIGMIYSGGGTFMTTNAKVCAR